MDYHSFNQDVLINNNQQYQYHFGSPKPGKPNQNQGIAYITYTV